MAVKDWSTTAASNTAIDGINIAEGCPPSGINDAIRAVMANVVQGDWGSGAVKIDNMTESTADAGVTIEGVTLKDSAITGYLADVMTTRGDLTVEGASGPARLAVGTNGQALLSDGTDPYWGAVTAGASATDMRLAFLLIAENSGDRVNMVDGIVDPFKDETDVDTATSTNEVHDSTNAFYEGLTSTALGSLTDSTNGSWAAQLAWVQVIPNSAFSSGKRVRVKLKASTAGTYGPVYLGHKAASGDAYDFAASPAPVQILFSGSSTVALGTDGEQWSDYASFAVDGSTDLSVAFTAPAVVSHATKATLTGYQAYYKASGDPSTVNKSGYSSASAQAVHAVHDLEIQSAANLTLVSNSFTADSAPSTGRLQFQVKENESITPNTDLLGDVSRDGGTTWTTATLALVETLADGTKAYEDASIDISGQPSGTSMEYRLRTANTKDIEAHGVVFQWS